MQAEYKCMRCKFEYEDSPGLTQCPKCNHLYIEWINHEQYRYIDNKG